MLVAQRDWPRNMASPTINVYLDQIKIPAFRNEQQEQSKMKTSSSTVFIVTVLVVLILVLHSSLTALNLRNTTLEAQARTAHTTIVALKRGHNFSLRSANAHVLPELDFLCQVPSEQRMGSGCWVSGMRGRYEGRKYWHRRHQFMAQGKSQSGEDLVLLQRYFFGRTGGTFLEMGALDGFTYSNTWYFEKYMSWRGVLIEGSPNSYELLVRYRPDAICINAMICSEKRTLHWVEGRGAATRGALELMTPEFRKKWHSGMTQDDIDIMPVVPCLRLSGILARFNVRHVDLFSLDVEGAEESVLKTIDFNKFTASVILVEYKHRNKGVHRILRSAGYIKEKKIANNHVYLHPRFKKSIRGFFIG